MIIFLIEHLRRTLLSSPPLRTMHTQLFCTPPSRPLFVSSLTSASHFLFFISSNLHLPCHHLHPFSSPLSPLRSLPRLPSATTKLPPLPSNDRFIAQTHIRSTGEPTHTYLYACHRPSNKVRRQRRASEEQDTNSADPTQNSPTSSHDQEVNRLK